MLQDIITTYAAHLKYIYIYQYQITKKGYLSTKMFDNLSTKCFTLYVKLTPLNATKESALNAHNVFLISIVIE